MSVLGARIGTRENFVSSMGADAARARVRWARLAMASIVLLSVVTVVRLAFGAVTAALAAACAATGLVITSSLGLAWGIYAASDQGRRDGGP